MNCSLKDNTANYHFGISTHFLPLQNGQITRLFFNFINQGDIFLVITTHTLTGAT